ncbi:MAG TPA: DUF2877 domain-containing protein [Nocardioidaceae bacterium]
MSSAPTSGCAASVLVTRLLCGPRRCMAEVARTTVSVHYETGDPDLPVLTVATPGAVRLPATVVTPSLPAPGALSMGSGRLWQRSRSWRVTRWWRPARPVGLHPPVQRALPSLAVGFASLGVPVPEPVYDGLRPEALIGSGPGLTPSGDDLVAGALVAGHATADPRFPRWRTATLATLGAASTTVVSRSLLHHACDGYATLELADFVDAVCAGRDAASATSRLLAVGHTSGTALLHGALHALTTHCLEGAA